MSPTETPRKFKPSHILEVANHCGIRSDEAECQGNYIAKINPSLLARLAERPLGKLICITGMNPTKEGEGKTSTAIGLTQALAYLKKRVILCLREPSMGPVFGFKGGGTGSGLSQVVPSEEINLHFTGDFHAITSAHNLLSAAIDNHIHHGNELGIEADHMLWRRVLDINDRQLRDIKTGLSKGCLGGQRKSGFDITASSEIMAALSLSKSLPSLNNKLEKISIALSKKGKLVTAKELKVSGAMSLLLKRALWPNLVQTLEGQPVFVHTGPFANVSHGNNSLISTTMALKLANYVVTESGFSSELGLEKFFDIVCREGELKPQVAVIVITLKALKSHSDTSKKASGKDHPLSGGYKNLFCHIENVRKFGIHELIAINRFPEDKEEEIQAVINFLASKGIVCAVSEAVKYGSKGALSLAEKVLSVLAGKNSDFKPLYPLSLSTESKIEKIAQELYGAESVVYADKAKEALAIIKANGLDNLPVNIAKTPYSLSDNPLLKGAPKNWKLKISEIRPYSGAGFLVALSGKILLMPGMPAHPMFESMS